MSTSFSGLYINLQVSPLYNTPDQPLRLLTTGVVSRKFVTTDIELFNCQKHCAHISFISVRRLIMVPSSSLQMFTVGTPPFNLKGGPPYRPKDDVDFFSSNVSVQAIQRAIFPSNLALQMHVYGDKQVLNAYTVPERITFEKFQSFVSPNTVPVDNLEDTSGLQKLSTQALFTIHANFIFNLIIIGIIFWFLADRFMGNRMLHNLLHCFFSVR